MSKRQLTRSERNKIILKIGIAAGVLIIIMVFILVALMPTNTPKTERTSGSVTPEGIIEVNGVKYVPKKNIETYLFMGIDNPGKVEKVEGYGGAGRCDYVMLVVRDLSTGTYKTLNINRNILMEQDSLEPDGTYIGTSTAILALAHENGDGMEISCENVVKTVSNFLGGQKIDGYAAVNMGAITIINNLVGGVTVTIEDDFSDINPSLVKGETITLTDEQAYDFVHSRWYVGDETNESRMRRQSAYLADLKLKLKQKCEENANYPVTIYDSLGAYMVTNITSQKFSKLALLMIKDKDDGELNIEGTSEVGDLEYAEMTADEESVKAAILELFYRKYE